MRVSFYTLGCKLNFAETSTIARLFAERGYARVDFGEPADVVVVNTCTVTGAADKKCRQAIHRAVKTSPDAFVIVTGCFAELKAAEIGAIDGVNMVVGNQDKTKILEALNNRGVCDASQRVSASDFVPAYSLHDRTRSFLKVQDGCDYRCTYCTIPKARGQSRNAPIADLLAQAREIVAHGAREIVLTGVNVGDFGRSTGETFIDLLVALTHIDGLERLRTGSIEPNLLTEAMVKLVAASPVLAPHFHIPLQSGCNRVLAMMARRYRRELFAEKIALIHHYLPLAGVGADVIVGFPGETDDDFAETCSFIESLDLSYLHVFHYSERPDTKAAVMPDKVPFAVAEARSHALIAMAERKRATFRQRHIGLIDNVLFEQQEHNGMMCGFTGSYIKTEMPFNEALIGRCTKVRISGVSASGNLTAEIIN